MCVCPCTDSHEPPGVGFDAQTKQLHVDNHQKEIMQKRMHFMSSMSLSFFPNLVEFDEKTTSNTSRSVSESVDAAVTACFHSVSSCSLNYSILMIWSAVEGSETHGGSDLSSEDHRLVFLVI